MDDHIESKGEKAVPTCDWLEPDKNGAWHWPFRYMEVGDAFKVAPELRQIGSVRSAAYAAAYRLGRRFSVTLAPDGAALVRRTGKRGYEATGLELNYPVLKARLAAIYRLDADDVRWEQIELEQRYKVEAPARGDFHKGVLVGIVGDRPYAVELMVDGFEIEPIPLNADLRLWLRERAARVLFDS